jgi:hypothetical protein
MLNKEHEVIPLPNETSWQTLHEEEVENRKNGRRIFWFVVGAFGIAILITILEKIYG